MRKIFIDCGAYNGNSVRKFSSSFNDFEIFSFEPNSLLAHHHKNLKSTLIQSAVWIKNEFVDFYIDEKDFDGSSVYSHKINIVGNKKIKVPAVDFSQWVRKEFQKNDFIVLKMDIEGAEYEVLTKMIKDGTIEYINELFIEFHWDRIGLDKKNHDELIRALMDKNIPTHNWDAISNRGNEIQYLKEKYKTKINCINISIIAYGPNQINGPNIWLQRILPKLAQRGVSAHVIFIMNSDKPCMILNTLQSNNIKCTSISKEKSTEFCIRKLLKLLQEDQPDIFIPNLSVPAYFAAKWIQDAGIPSIGVIRSDDNFHHELIETFAHKDSEFKLAAFVCKSQYLAKLVLEKEFNKNSVLICPSGTPIPENVATPPTNKLKIIYTGRLIQRQKRIFDVIASCRMISRLVDGVEITFYGEDREGGNAISTINNLNKNDHIRHGGLLKFEEILPTLVQHHVFILLSDYEGMSTSLMEAMACGLVPICTRTRSGSTEIIQHNQNGLLVENREEDFLNAVLRLKTEKGLWERLSKGARATIENKYAIDICADKWTNFLNELLKKKSVQKQSIKLPELHEIILPPVKQTDNGMCREDKRIPRIYQPAVSQSPLHDNFLNPRIFPGFADLYIVRSAIKNSLDKHLHLFHGTLLDVGCGQMPYKNHILKMSPNIKRYIGLDFSHGKYADIKQPDITWDGKTIPLDSASVDCCLATEVLEHCHQPMTVLKEIRRVLKPDGVFFFTSPFIWPLHDTPHDHYRYTPFSLKLLLNEAGFEDVQINAMGGWDASLAQMIGLWLKRAPMTDDIRQQMSQKLFPFFKQLVELDNHASQQQHADNTISPGWSGIAYTPLKTVTNSTDIISEPSHQKICIVRHEHFAYSQTFIEDHIAYISQNTSVIHGESFPMFDQNKKCILSQKYIKPTTDYQYNVSKKIYTDAFQYYLNDNKFDVILSEFGTVAAKIYKACEKSGIPYVVHFHGYDATATPTLQAYKHEYSDIFKSAAALIVVSKAMRDKLISIGAPINKVFLNPYGVDVQRDDLASPESSKPIFLAVGRFVEKKAPHITIQAFEKTAKSIPNSRLVMVGDGPLLKACQELAKKLNIQNQVQFAGVQTRRSVAKLLRLSRAFLQHSVTAANGDTEGLPLAILEAGAAGLPVISTRHAGIPDAVIEGENGLLVDEGDVQKMSEAIFQLAINPNLAGWMGKNYHRRVVEHFSRETSIQGLRTILRSAADSRHNPTSTPNHIRSDVSEPPTTRHFAESSNNLRYCPICQQTSQAFVDFGRPVRKNAMCPQCGSLERHRFIWKYLQEKTNLFQQPDTQTLHFAPEPCLEINFRRLFANQYITADLYDKKADIQADITDINFSSESFSFIYCSHVLEHVPNDRKAMQEIYRILKLNGLAVIMVPIKGEITDEDFSITNPSERQKRYGQEDHVRYYGMDIVDRLREAGFKVEHIEPQDVFAHKDIAHMSLGGEKLLLCRK